MNTITLILAQLFDKFKAANPQLAASLILLFGLIIYAAENGLGDLIGYRCWAFLTSISTSSTPGPTPPIRGRFLL